jgi:hypothetical protein
LSLTKWGELPLAAIGAEFLLQIIADRAEEAALIMTTNLPVARGMRDA